MRIAILVSLLSLLAWPGSAHAADELSHFPRRAVRPIGVINDIDCLWRVKIEILADDALVIREAGGATEAAVRSEGAFLQEPLSDEARVRSEDIFLIPALPDEARQPPCEEPQNETLDGMLLAQ